MKPRTSSKPYSIAYSAIGDIKDKKGRTDHAGKDITRDRCENGLPRHGGSRRERRCAISPHLPTSPHISPHLPTSPHISPHLPHISPHFPICRCCRRALALRVLLVVASLNHGAEIQPRYGERAVTVVYTPPPRRRRPDAAALCHVLKALLSLPLSLLPGADAR